MKASDILGDPAASNWLKSALREALMRDPIDAANDAELLARVLLDRATSILSAAIARPIAGAKEAQRR
jgi:hypothetical protein